MSGNGKHAGGCCTAVSAGRRGGQILRRSASVSRTKRWRSRSRGASALNLATVARMVTPSVTRWSRNDRFRPRQVGYPLSVRRQVCGVQRPLLCFRSTGLYARRLPSLGRVRRARFPDVVSTMEALRLPARAHLVPYGFGSRLHVFLLSFVLAEALPVSVEVAQQAWAFGQPACPFPACCTRGRVRDITGSLAIHPMPLPCSRTPAEPTRPRF
jgi:hypothetical protein